MAGLSKKEQVRSDVRGPDSLSPQTALAPLFPALLPQVQGSKGSSSSSDSCWGRGSYTGPVPKELQRKKVAAPAPPWDVTADHMAGRSHHSGQEAGFGDVGARS